MTQDWDHGDWSSRVGWIGYVIAVKEDDYIAVCFTEPRNLAMDIQDCGPWHRHFEKYKPPIPDFNYSSDDRFSLIIEEKA